jgi:hypothetical protein
MGGWKMGTVQVQIHGRRRKGRRLYINIRRYILQVLPSRFKQTGSGLPIIIDLEITWLREMSPGPNTD